MAGDKIPLFGAIANEEVYISRRRLNEPVYQHQPYRERGLVFEETGEEVYDLLRRMLIKHPVERVTLKEVKHHLWVIRDIDNSAAWLNGTGEGHW